MQSNVFWALFVGSVACLSPAHAEDKVDVMNNWFKVGVECMEKLQIQLEKVVDKASADKAAPEVKAANEKLLKLIADTEKSFKAPSEFERAVMKYPDKLQKVIALGQKLEPEQERIVKAKYFESQALKKAMDMKALSQEMKKASADQKSPDAGKKP